LRCNVDRNVFAARLFMAKCRKQITACQYLVGRAMLRRANKKGVCWPSLERIANDAGNVCVKTVQRAKERLRELGFLEWIVRRKFWSRHDTCLYSLRLPPLRSLLQCDSTIKELNELSSSDKMSNGSGKRPPPAQWPPKIHRQASPIRTVSEQIANIGDAPQPSEPALASSHARFLAAWSARSPRKLTLHPV
jgi:DNA-binding transcriptional regulator YhcF (GntR family)